MKFVLVFGVVVSAVWGYYWFARGRFICKAKRILDKDPGSTILKELVDGNGSIDDLKKWLESYDKCIEAEDAGKMKELLS